MWATLGTIISCRSVRICFRPLGSWSARECAVSLLLLPYEHGSQHIMCTIYMTIALGLAQVSPPGISACYQWRTRRPNMSQIYGRHWCSLYIELGHRSVVLWCVVWNKPNIWKRENPNHFWAFWEPLNIDVSFHHSSVTITQAQIMSNLCRHV